MLLLQGSAFLQFLFKAEKQMKASFSKLRIYQLHLCFVRFGKEQDAAIPLILLHIWVGALHLTKKKLTRNCCPCGDGKETIAAF